VLEKGHIYMRKLMHLIIILVFLNGIADAAVLVLNPNGTSIAKPSLAVANTAADVSGKTVVVSGVEALTAPLQWRRDAVLRIAKGGEIKTAGFAVTINGPFQAELSQVFSGNGAVSFGAGSVSEVYPEWFGSVGNGSSDDSEAIKKAIRATPAGATTSLSHAAISYKYNNSGGLTSAAVIDKAITLKINSTVAGTSGGIQSNPPFVFKITANDVVVTGTGIVKFSGTPNDENRGKDATMPGLLFVSGNRCKITGLTFDTPPKTAIMLYNSSLCEVVRCKFIGGISTYTTGHTALFGVRLFGGGKHNISHNVFESDKSKKRLICAIFANGSNDNVITDNKVYSLFEKVVYLFGNNNSISNNYASGVSITAPYRVHGSNNKIQDNIAENCKGGVQITDGQSNSIIGNSLTGCVQGGISVQGAKNGTGISNTKIQNNRITGTGISSPDTQDGILVYTQFADASNITISNNTVTGFSSTNETKHASSIRLQAVGTHSIDKSTVANNKCDDNLFGISIIKCRVTTVDSNTTLNSNYGIYVRDSDSVKISNNTAKNITRYAWGIFGANTNVSFFKNSAFSPAHIGIYGITETPVNGNYGSGNRFD
jgi:parallel beta-helix repeat protein